ncbi:MAG: type IV pilin protein [Woeseiaceae bacterium]|nr:type IV pilin protein [Woeseiaceae bacterium]
MSKSKGFTLIELMIVVAIIGIIAAVAYPSYQEQVNKSRRGDCTGALVGLANAMERFYTVNSTYRGAADGGADTGAPAATLFSATCPVDGGTPVYNLTIAQANASQFTLRATPTGAQTGDRCGIFTLTNTGVKNIASAAAGVEWEACW